MFFEILNISLAVVFILIIWFKTNAFCEYLEYFHFQNHFFINDYYKFRSKSRCSLHYNDFLLLNNNSFFINIYCVGKVQSTQPLLQFLHSSQSTNLYLCLLIKKL